MSCYPQALVPTAIRSKYSQLHTRPNSTQKPLPHQDSSSDAHDSAADRTTSDHLELQLSQFSLHLLPY